MRTLRVRRAHRRCLGKERALAGSTAAWRDGNPATMSAAHRLLMGNKRATHPWAHLKMKCHPSVYKIKKKMEMEMEMEMEKIRKLEFWVHLKRWRAINPSMCAG